MRRELLALLCALCATPAFAVGPADDNVLIGDGTTWLSKALTNCTGAGKAVTYNTATNAWGCNTISGGSGNFVSVTVTFTAGVQMATTTVAGQAWVTTSPASTITCRPQHNAAVSGINNTPEVYMAAQLSETVANLVAATGWDLIVYSPAGASGSFNFTCSGV